MLRHTTASPLARPATRAGMRALRRATLACACLLAPTAAVAQASPYLPLDDPRLPLLEHLIARGDIADPSPFVRPFRRADAARVLAEADSGGPGGDAIHRLWLEMVREDGKDDGEGGPRALRADTADEWAHWRVEVRAGGEAYRFARRDEQHPAGVGNLRPYGDIRLEALVGPIALVSRPAAEPRLLDDPDWPGRKDLKFTGRMVDAYASAQFRWGSIFYGQMDRNWGPVGMPGIGLSNAAYPRTEAALDIGTRTLRLQATAAELRDAANPAGAEPIHRYFFAHRLGLRLSDRVNLGLWETVVLAGPARNFDGRYRNPLSLLVLANEYGQGDDGNALIGLDLAWRAFGRTTVETQLGIDDIQYQDRGSPTRYPDRWALTVAAHGPLARSFAWRALYTRATSLAFRTLDSTQNFTDAGVGLGRNFDDMDQVTLRVTAPWRDRWLFTPEATLIRQGEGAIDLPVPPAGTVAAGETPQIFIGTVERTWRLALAVSGREGPFDLQADAGWHHVVNAGHVPGATANRFVGRIQALLRFAAGGPLH
jgi:hypothetical protein